MGFGRTLDRNSKTDAAGIKPGLGHGINTGELCCIISSGTADLIVFEVLVKSVMTIHAVSRVFLNSGGYRGALPEFCSV